MALKPNKIEYGGRTLIDLTGDSVIADALVEGYSAHDKSGELINGANPYEKNATDTEVNTQAEQIEQLREILSNKAAGTEDLTAVLDAQEALITDLEELLERKTAGPGESNCATCTVVVGLEGISYVQASFYRVVDGVITKQTPVYVEDADGITTTITVTDVVCSSMIYFDMDHPDLIISNNIYEGLNDGTNMCLAAPIAAGDIGEIRMA
jgi:hypothetical protein